MAFTKYASAVVVQPNVSKTEWRGVRVAATPPKVASNDLNGNLLKRAEELFDGPFDPSKYLLTHATIIASVDTYEPSGTKVGSVLEDGFRVNRKFGDFRVTSDTQKYINNNRDAWQRDVLLASFQTFIGGHNFVEHVQVEELSKGRIIDAVARDINGETIYIDILIATDRKHTDLVKAIESGKMGTLSMGCTVDGTICTKCGHWAADETEMCDHIKYAKGNTFIDENGVQMVIAELCGHKSIGPTGGVHFVEASWVGTPAFTGAVKRNILVPSAEVSRQAAKILASPPPQWASDEMRKVASLLGTETGKDRILVGRVDSAPVTGKQEVRNALDNEDVFFAGWMDEDEGGGGGDDAEGEAAPAAPAAPDADPLDDAATQLEQHLLDRAIKKVKDRMQKKDVGDALSDQSSMAPNDNIIKEAKLKMYAGGLSAIIRTASSQVQLIDSVAAYNQQVGVQLPVQVYRAALIVGGSDQYPTVGEFREACDRAFGRTATTSEAKAVLKLGRMLSRWDRAERNF